MFISPKNGDFLDCILRILLLLTDAHKLDERDTEVIVFALFPALIRDVDYSEDEERQHGDDCEAVVDLHEALELRPLLYLDMKQKNIPLNGM